jgi:hypothetical protein
MTIQVGLIGAGNISETHARAVPRFRRLDRRRLRADAARPSDSPHSTPARPTIRSTACSIDGRSTSS